MNLPSLHVLCLGDRLPTEGGEVIKTAMTKGKEKADQVEKNKKGWEGLERELKKFKEKNQSCNT